MIYIYLYIFFFISLNNTDRVIFKYMGLGDPVRYDSNYIYGYAPK